VKRFVAALMMLSGLLVAGGANATYTFTFTESGGNVVATGSGTLNITGLVLNAIVGGNGYIWPFQSSVVSSDLNNNPMDRYSANLTGPTLGSAGITAKTSNTGDGVGFWKDSGLLFVPQNYVSGAQLTSSQTWNGATLALLGLTVGTYTFSYGTAPNNDSFVVIVGNSPTPAAVPSLSEWAQLMLGLMVMMLIGWHFHRERSY